MQYLTTLVGHLTALYTRVKGAKTVYEIKGPKNALGNLQCITNCGCQLTIFCQRKEYLVKYDKWYVPNSKHYVYRVMSLVTGQEIPELLQRACNLDVTFPHSLAAPGATDDLIARTMVNAYLDMLEAILGKFTCT